MFQPEPLSTDQPPPSCLRSAMPRKQREKNKSKRSTALDRRRFHTRRVTPKTDAVGSVNGMKLLRGPLRHLPRLPVPRCRRGLPFVEPFRLARPCRTITAQPWVCFIEGEIGLEDGRKMFPVKNRVVVELLDLNRVHIHSPATQLWEPTKNSHHEITILGDDFAVALVPTLIEIMIPVWFCTPFPFLAARFGDFESRTLGCLSS